MTYEEFEQKYNNEYVERYDSSNPHECVDLALMYIDKVGGLGSIIPIGVATAEQMWTKTTKLSPYVTKIPNTPDAIPQKGDVVIWSGSYNGGAGHVGIANGWGSTSSFRCLEQNDPLGSKTIIKQYNYNHVLGWLRLINSNQNMLPDNYEIIIKKSTQWDETVNKLELGKPEDILAEAIINLIGELKSSITAAQRERDEARTKTTNAIDELSRVRAQMLILESDKQNALVSNKKLIAMNEEQGRVIGGLNEDKQRLETENRELKKNVVTGLDASELLRLALLKFLRLG